MYPIPPYIEPTENWCVLHNAFSAEQVDKIIKVARHLKFKQGVVGNNELKKDVRDSDISWIDLDPNLPALDVRQWILGQVAACVSRVNHDKFQMDLTDLDGLQFTKYALNGMYKWHTDAHQGDARHLHRKLSGVLMLSDPTDYEGGELLINVNGDQDKPMSIKNHRKIDNPDFGKVEGAPEHLYDSFFREVKKGDFVFFYSHMPHTVMPVTSGERMTLVTWALGPKMM